MKINFLRNSEHTMIFFGKILLKTLYFFITNISELDFEEKKSAEIVLHPMHGVGAGVRHLGKIPKKYRFFGLHTFCKPFV